MTYPNPTPNDDEEIDGFIGSFRKTLPHDVASGKLSENEDFREFKKALLKLDRGEGGDLGKVPGGAARRAKFVSPLAGASTETHGPDPQALEMRPAPGFLSESAVAEMIELYWMALLRDKPISAFMGDTSVDADIVDAVTDVAAEFSVALATDKSDGALKLGEDLPENAAGQLDIRPQTLFRCGLPGEEHGPLISQFFIRDIPYGTQRIDQSQVPYRSKLDFLITWNDWYRAQNIGYDKFDRDYGNCNFYGDDHNYYDTSNRRTISTLRDLARFVNRDALHQAYFNAALFLDAVGAPVDLGNPYREKDPNNPVLRDLGFATLGGPDLLTLVSEVASRALKVVWRQKWFVHRRARPEVYGGLLHAQEIGVGGTMHPSGLPTPKADRMVWARLRNYIRQESSTKEEGLFLPIAFSAGSPVHPAYGAGHATVAGACVTVLKAWFDENETLVDLFGKANDKKSWKEPPPVGGHKILQPSVPDAAGKYGPPIEYKDAASKLTVGGELNKLASNVAMGRSMGGVHWRSDNTRSLRLGERVAIEILRKRTLEYAEPNVSFSFTSFDGKAVKIQGGKVHIS